MFMVITNDGNRVFDRAGKGVPEDQAKASADERNQRAAEMGIKTRYEIAPFEKGAPVR